MHSIRTSRPQHVPVPPPTPSTVPGGARELSREERQQLRELRHTAFVRHQRNATWFREVLEYQSDGTSDGENPSPLGPDATAVGMKTEANGGTSGHDIERRRLETRLTGLREDVAREKAALLALEGRVQGEQTRHATLLSCLQAIATSEDLVGCRERIVRGEVVAGAEGSASRPKELKILRL